jgi:hypothetical protein
MSAEGHCILLVGRGFMPGSAFLERLCGDGCSCTVAHSLQDAKLAICSSPVDVVLSEMGLPDGSAFPLLAVLEGTQATLYFCVGVHDGCWWLPALARGERTWGQPALRPAEFAEKLSEILSASALHAAAASASAPNLIPIPRPSEVDAARPVRLADAENRQTRKTSA